MFTLKDDGPQRLEALRLATLVAHGKAAAIAAALDLKVQRVVSVDEGGTFVQPVLREQAMRAEPQGARSTQTALAVGDVEVRARVSIEVEVGP
jgi:uncharacterized protein YggE